MKNFYKIHICDRVDLFVSNEGFIFSNKETPTEFYDWKEFKYYWFLYFRDGIEEKVKLFLSGFPDRYKSQNFYQGLKFE